MTIHFVVLPIPTVHLDDGGFVTIGIGICSRATECLSPISGESFNMLGVKTMAERMGHHLIGHNPLMPGGRKTPQAVVATRCLEDSLHVPIMTILLSLFKTLTPARAHGAAISESVLNIVRACHSPFSHGCIQDSDESRASQKPTSQSPTILTSDAAHRRQYMLRIEE